MEGNNIRKSRNVRLLLLRTAVSWRSAALVEDGDAGLKSEEDRLKRTCASKRVVQYRLG